MSSYVKRKKRSIGTAEQCIMTTILQPKNLKASLVMVVWSSLSPYLNAKYYCVCKEAYDLFI